MKRRGQIDLVVARNFWVWMDGMMGSRNKADLFSFVSEVWMRWFYSTYRREITERQQWSLMKAWKWEDEIKLVKLIEKQDTWTQRKIVKKLTQQTKSSGGWRSYTNKKSRAPPRGEQSCRSVDEEREVAGAVDWTLEQALYCNARDERLKQPVNYSDPVMHRQRQGSALAKYLGNFLDNYSAFQLVPHRRPNNETVGNSTSSFHNFRRNCMPLSCKCVSVHDAPAQSHFFFSKSNRQEISRARKLSPAPVERQQPSPPPQLWQEWPSQSPKYSNL